MKIKLKVLLFLLCICVFSFIIIQPTIIIAETSKNAEQQSIFTERMNKTNKLEDENRGILKKIDESLLLKSRFNFKEIDPEELVKKTEEVGDNLYLIAQSYSWPLFVWSIILGVGSLFFGGLFGSKWFKKTGMFFLGMAVVRVVIINLAPEIVVTILTWIDGLKG